LEDIGWRATAAALSDLAAAAAHPVGVVTAVIVPRDADPEGVVALMRGVGAAAAAAGAKVLGGDLTAGEMWAVISTVFGRAVRRMSRTGARSGDGLWVTGTLGGARAALDSWRGSKEPDPAARAAFAHPVSRIAAAQWLAAHGATAMMDISDGLGGDAEHLAAASGVGIEIDLALVPRHPSVDAVAARRHDDAELVAASGGEDYELLVTMPPAFDDSAALRDATGVSLTRIGSILEGAGVRALLRGEARTIRGYRHPV
ncbi:MAG: thiamine-phosphate kinase, partial [Gemmatimonadales bacterium]